MQPNTNLKSQNSIFSAFSILILIFLTLSFQVKSSDIQGPSDTQLLELHGVWEGELQYIDYRSGKPVGIPLTRIVSVAPDASYLLFENIFTDPGRKVYSAEMVTVLSNSVETASVYKGELTTTSAQIESFQRTESGWRLILNTMGEDNNQPADIQFVWEVTRMDGVSLKITKMVKTEDENEYSLRNRVLLNKSTQEQ